METQVQDNTVKALAAALAKIGTQGQKTEDLASTMLRTVKAVRTIEAFDATVKAAYEINGWNSRQGRPSAEKRDKVPNTVRTYVWEMRSALKTGVKVWECKNFYELRIAHGKAREKAVKKAARNAPVNGNGGLLPDIHEFAGTRVTGQEPNGALFHDLILVFALLAPEQRVLLGRNLNRMLHRYQMVIPIAAVQKKRSTG